MSIINRSIEDIFEFDTYLDIEYIASDQPSSTILITKSGGHIQVKAPDVLTIEDLNYLNHYSIVKYVTYTVTDTLSNIRAFKQFLNYYRNEAAFLYDHTGIYESRLDFSESTRKAMNMFSDDTTITLNFFAIKVG